MSVLDKAIGRPLTIAALCCALASLYGCPGTGSGGTAVAGELVRFSNFSAAPTLTANINGSTTPGLTTGQTSCTTQINGPASGANESLTFRDGSGGMLGSSTASVSYDRGTLSILVYGPPTALQVLPVDSDSVPGAFVITAADLSASGANYQVFVKDVDTGVSTQTSPISVTSRQVGLPVTAAGNYQVLVQSGGSTFTSATFAVDTNHARPIVAFYDGNNGTLTAVVVHGADACIG